MAMLLLFIRTSLSTAQISKVSAAFSQPFLGWHETRTVNMTPANRPGKATGPLRVDPANRRYFTDGSGRAILLAAAHTWYTLQDSGRSDPPPAFDYDAFLASLQAHGSNFFRMFVFEQAKYSVLVAGDYYYSPLPYQRTGPGTALDGKPKFDVAKFNQAYFDRLRERVMLAGDKGIYVSIQLFEGFSVEHKPFMAQNNPWPGHPFNKANNINGVDGDLNQNGEGEETHTLQAPAVTALQEAYVRKIIDTVNDLDNVLFEISNESPSNSQDWQYHIINYIKTYEAGKPKQHPVGMTVEWPSGNNAELFASPADWISPNADGGYFADPPPADGSKIILNDTDHLCYPCGDRQWMWKSVLRGLNPAFMDPYDCTGDPSPGNCQPNDPSWVNLRLNLGYAVNYANRLNLAATAPRADLASSGYCLANATAQGAEYLVYLPAGSTVTALLQSVGLHKHPSVYLLPDSTVTVDLSAAQGELNVEWLNPETGATIADHPTTGGAQRSFTAPFSGDAVLYLYQTAQATATPTPTASSTVTPQATASATVTAKATNTPVPTAVTPEPKTFQSFMPLVNQKAPGTVPQATP
ncbi:MAG: DUF6298 domain-containing protein [Caldilineaceae bacterium]